MSDCTGLEADGDRSREVDPFVVALRELPKAHLHLHVIGAMRRRFLVSQFDPSVRGLFRRVYSQRQFAKLYDTAVLAVRSPADFERLVFQVVEDQAADGVWWVEITIDPFLYKGRLGSPQRVLEMARDFGAAASERFGVGVGWIVCANRGNPAASTLAAELAVSMVGDGVVGFGLAGDERLAGSGAFERPFRAARDAGLLLCPHAGELHNEVDIQRALMVLHPDRLGHALGAVRNPLLLRNLAERGVAAETAPWSNVGLGLIAGCPPGVGTSVC
jgi:adenosine deaminase